MDYGLSIPLDFPHAVGTPALSPVFTAAIDDMAARGQTWARLGANEDVVLVENLCTAASLTWNAGNLALYDNAIAYIRAKGLKVWMVLFPPIYFTTHQLVSPTNAGTNTWSLERVDGLIVGETVVVGFGGAAEAVVIASINTSTKVVTSTTNAALTHATGTAFAMAQSDYEHVVSMYCASLAQRWAGKVDMWQTWNEVNIGDFRFRSNNPHLDFTPVIAGGSVPTLDSTYLAELASAMAVARAAIRTYDGAPITTNTGASNIAYDAAAQSQYVSYFGAIINSIDAISEDQYDAMLTNVDTKVGYLTALKTMYAKPLYIAEAGWWWNSAGYPGASETVQRDTISRQVDALRRAGPEAIILFQYHDEIPTPQYLGIVKDDATHTLGYDAWFDSQITDPPVITAVTPNSASVLGGVTVTIAGDNFFTASTSITFDGIPATAVNVLSKTRLTCTVPLHPAIGSSALSVTTPRGTTTNPAIFTFAPDPRIVVTSAGLVTYATNELVRTQDTGSGFLRAHIYAPAPLGTADAARTHVVSVDAAESDVTMTQANRFDGHTVTFKEDNPKIVAALVQRATVDLEEPGLGVVAQGIVVKPSQAVTVNGDGTITVALDNRTAEMAQANLGLGYIDRQEIGQIVRNMGAATTVGESKFLGRDATGLALTSVVPGTSIGWSASYLDDGAYETSVAPVFWGPTASGNGVPGALSGAILDLAANGNSIRRDALAPSTPNYPSAVGIPGHDDPNRALEMTYQVVVPTQGVCGFVNYLVAGQAPPWGFQHSYAKNADGTYQYYAQVVDAGLPIGAPIPVQPNSRFMVRLFAGSSPLHFYYYIQQPNDPGFVTAHIGLAVPAPPWFPGAAITAAGGEFGNVTVKHDVPMSRIWWQITASGLSNLGGLIQLATDTGMFVRQQLDRLTAAPLKALEFGPLGEDSGVTLVDVGGADIARLKRNPRKRIIKEVTEYSRVDNMVTVLTAIGAGTPPAVVTMERLYLMLNDLSYEHFYGKYSGGVPDVFPEYDGNFSIHRVGTLSVGYEYYIRYEPAFLPGGVGEIRGEPYVNQSLALPPAGATTAEQELVARKLYQVAVEQMKAGLTPRVTFTATLVGAGRPPRSGSKVRVDYTHLAAAKENATQKIRSWVPMRITRSPAADGLWRVLKVERRYGQGEPEDQITLSSDGRYSDSIEAASGEQRQALAVQLNGRTTAAPMMVSRPRENIDAANPIRILLHIDESYYSITKMRVRAVFAPYQQPVKTSKNPTGTPIVTTLDIPIELETPGDINLGGTFNADGSGAPGTTDGFQLVQTGVDNDAVVQVLISNDGQDQPLGQRLSAQLQTNPTRWRIHSTGVPNNSPMGANMKINFTKAQTKSAFTAPINKLVKKAGTVIAHILPNTHIADEPQHVHDVDPDLHELTEPTEITVKIDSGDGVLIDRTAQVSDGSNTGPWHGDFVFECARFVNSPGRDVEIAFYSTNNANHGRGALIVSYTLVGTSGDIGELATLRA